MRRAQMMAGLLLLLACTASQVSSAAPPAGVKQPVVEWIYKGELGPGWKDNGYAPHGNGGGGLPQELNMEDNGGWILAKPGFQATPEELAKYGGLSFRYRAPSHFGDFLDVRLATDGEQVHPNITITAARRSQVGSWFEVFVPMTELNPKGLAWDRVRFRASKKVSGDWVLFDQIGLTGGQGVKISGVAPIPGAKFDGPAKAASLAMRCGAGGHAISPYIYGITSSHQLDTPLTELGSRAARWGGNTSSRYNWKLGNAWNAGADWYFRNNDYARNPSFSWKDELEFNLGKGAINAVSLPMLGWVAKNSDNGTFSFPVSEFGQQQDMEDGAGNGFSKSGKPLKPGPPTKTSVPAPPEFVAEWVKAIKALDRGGKRAVQMYFYDNEPFLWNETHRDVHPAATTYDELLQKTIAYGTAVRKADPEALLAGPTEWGWTGFLYSAADKEAGFTLRPDRRAHGDMEQLPWYLKKLAEHEKKTGVRLLDVVDVHYYPQTKGMGLFEQGGIDPDTNARRLRSTRGLWDPNYKDESWIDENVMLIPRLKGWINENYPGRKISIGEWNWGAENHMSGGLAVAEVLGRYGQQNIYAAFYWRYPKADTPAWHAFRAFGNYDGKGARFLDWHVPTEMQTNVSLFASRDASKNRYVLVALNLDPGSQANALIRLDGCGNLTPRRAFRYTGEKSGPRALEGADAPKLSALGLTAELPPYSITVFELEAPRAP
jgi:hypothetical protein